MKWIRKQSRVIAIAVACVGLGAGASAIAVAGASTSKSSGGSSARAASHARLRGFRALKRAVHGDLVVATNTGFATVTFDRGTVQSVSGPQLTLNEGSKTHTYKTLTLTIPATARVRDNGKLASLSSVTAGQRVLVVQGPKAWHVIAHTPHGG